jgi:hypothetical protein
MPNKGSELMAQCKKLVCRGITLGLMALLLLACGLLPSETTGPEVLAPAGSDEEDPTPTGEPVLILPGTWHGGGDCTIERTTLYPASWDGSVEFVVSESGREVTSLEIHCSLDSLSRDIHCGYSVPWESPPSDCRKIVRYRADFSAAPLEITNEIFQFTDEENEMTVVWLFSSDGTSVNVIWVVENYASGQSLIER